MTLQFCNSEPHVILTPTSPPRLPHRDTADGDVFRGHRILAPRVSSWKPWYTTNLPKKRIDIFVWMPRCLAKFQDDVWNSLFGITVNLLLVNSQCWKINVLCALLSFLDWTIQQPSPQKKTNVDTEMSGYKSPWQWRVMTGILGSVSSNACFVDQIGCDFVVKVVAKQIWLFWRIKQSCNLHGTVPTSSACYEPFT